jgi:hypothetical protein
MNYAIGTAGRYIRKHLKSKRLTIGKSLITMYDIAGENDGSQGCQEVGSVKLPVSAAS